MWCNLGTLHGRCLNVRARPRTQKISNRSAAQMSGIKAWQIVPIIVGTIFKGCSGLLHKLPWGNVIQCTTIANCEWYANHSLAMCNGQQTHAWISMTPCSLYKKTSDIYREMLCPCVQPKLGTYCQVAGDTMMNMTLPEAASQVLEDNKIDDKSAADLSLSIPGS